MAPKLNNISEISPTVMKHSHAISQNMTGTPSQH